MGKKNGIQQKATIPSSLMFPSLHEEVAEAVSEHIDNLLYHGDNSDKNVSKEYSTFVMGYFRCYSHTCSTHGWGSGKVTTLIRTYRDGSYNAVVYLQRCKGCGKLGNLIMDNESYISRVKYRLLRSKKCPPHLSHLCEGCKRGICREGNPRMSY
ncbi:hypothetical protein SVAN01_11071 [Stagonosporopsis vannaccii]|nr:hypothetical protein SVAN01_11071 [Stagonosporopsis vannaccii]